MFKYRNLVRNQTRISDTEPKSDSEIPVWTPDSVHHKHKRHSSLNDVPHNHSATLPPLCMSEDTGTMTETSPRGHLSRIWRPTGNLVCPWEAGSHQQRLWPSVSPAGPVSEPSPCRCGPVLLNQAAPYQSASVWSVWWVYVCQWQLDSTYHTVMILLRNPPSPLCPAGRAICCCKGLLISNTLDRSNKH